MTARLAYIDRSNLGNAKIAGMYDDLELYGMKYNTALTVFFVPYALFEVPSNIVLKIIRPSIWISVLCFAWGLVMTLMGLVNSYSGLIAARFFLGVTEAGFFPAATFVSISKFLDCRSRGAGISSTLTRCLPPFPTPTEHRRLPMEPSNHLLLDILHF